MRPRLEIDHYAMLLAYAAKLRSEDPFLKVGAVALSPENRVIATGYNGLTAGHNAPDTFWTDREARLPHMIHAEVNLCSLFVRGAAKTVAVTTMPCRSCATTLLAHGVKRVIYGETYHRDDSATAVFEFAKVELICLPPAELSAALLTHGLGVRVASPEPIDPTEFPGVIWVADPCEPHDFAFAKFLQTTTSPYRGAVLRSTTLVNAEGLKLVSQVAMAAIKSYFQ